MTNATMAKQKRRMAREPKAAATEDHAASQPGAAQEQANIDATEKPNTTAKVLSLLKRNGGASLTELIEGTGWLPHTARAALTGLKKKGTIDRNEFATRLRHRRTSQLADDLDALASLSPAQLREKWSQMERAAPPSIPPALLRRLVAQRL